MVHPGIVKNGWMPLWPALREGETPKTGRKPRAFIVWRANYLNQAKGNEILETSLWKDLDLIVDINYRMDTTALYSDVVLPAASYYEKVDLNSTDCHSYIHPFGKACRAAVRKQDRLGHLPRVGPEDQ